MTRRPPPWWPQGEEWSGHGPPWMAAPRRFRRRFLLVTVAVLVALVGIGVAIGIGAKRLDGGPPTRGERRGGPFGAIWLVGFVLVVGGGPTALAYRRISRPVADLLAAADKVSRGEYDVDVRPDGPREVRALTTTFNELAPRLAASEDQPRRFLA